MLRLKEAEIERINAEVRRLKKRYAEAESEFEDAIEKIYAKYADENGIIDVNIAKAFLTGKETDITLKEYEKLVKESLEKGNFEAERILQGWAKRERITRLDQMKLETDLIAKKLYEDTEGTLTKALGKSGRESYLMSAYELQKGLKNWSPMYAPSASYFEALARQQYNGKDFSERLWGHISNFSDIVHNVVKTSIIHGYGVDKAVKLMAGEVVADRKHIERLIRTEIARVQEQATLESYEVNEVTKYRFLATLDLKTSKQCQSLDMKVFDLTKDQTFSVDYGGKVGKVTYTEKGGVVGVNYPPMHPYCRSTTVPYVEDYTPSSRTSKDPLTGKEKKVRGDMTYAEWYKEYVEDAPLGKWAEKHKDKLPSDMRQWERYKTRLKGGVPDSFDKFIELKYGDDQEKWLGVQMNYRYRGIEDRMINKYKVEEGVDLKIFDDVSEIPKEYKKGKGDYTKADVEAIYKYSEKDVGIKYNKILGGVQSANADDWKDINNIAEALEHSSLPYDTMTFRGASHKTIANWNYLYDKMEKGGLKSIINEEMILSSFTSSSILRNTQYTDDSKDVYMCIINRAGKSGATYINDVSYNKANGLPEEYEVLIQKESKMKIIELQKLNGKYIIVCERK